MVVEWSPLLPGQRLYESYTGIKGTYSFALSFHNILNVSWYLAIKHFVVLFSFSRIFCCCCCS